MRTFKQVRELLASEFETVRAREGKMLVVQRGFFYRHGYTAEKFAERVLTFLKEKGVTASLVSKREHWGAWPKRSYWEVVILPEGLAEPKRKKAAPVEAPKFEAKIEVREERGKERGKKARVYFFHEGESVLEGFGARAARPTELYGAYLPQVAAALGIPAEEARFRWSRKAGCSCGCSPGFIAEGVYSKTACVTLSPEAPTTSGKPREEAEAAARISQLVDQLSAEQRTASEV